MQEKILLVEDDRDIVDYLSSFLKNENFIVEAVAGQREAIEKLETREYDLLLIDISLADGNGYAVCAAAKEKSPAAVIFLTASGDEYSVVTGLDMGADDYINKPFRPRELVSRIRSVLRRMGSTKSNEKKVEKHGNHKSTRRRETRLRQQNERDSARIQPKQSQHRTVIQNRPSNRNSRAVLLRHRTERNNL